MANFPTSLDADSSLLVATNFCRSSLASDMTDVQNTIVLSDASSFPDPAGATYYVVIDAATSASREICGYTGISTNTLTGVTRHTRGTTAHAHLTGVLVEQNIIDAYHEFMKSAMIAVETRVGITGSAVTTTHAYKLSGVTGSDIAVGVSASQVLTNKTLTAPTIGTSITLSSAVTKIVPGATSIQFRDTADAATNLLIVDAGNATLRGSLTTTSLILTTAVSKLIPGATSFSVRNNGDSADNLLVSDAGLLTVRLGLVVNGALSVFNKQYYSAMVTTSSSGAALTIDMNAANVQSVPITAACTFTINNMVAGSRYVLLLNQGGAGAFAYTWPASFKWADGTAPTASATGKTDLIAFVYNGTYAYASAILNF